MIPNLIVFLAVFGLTVLGTYHLADIILAHIEHRRMKAAQARIQARLKEAIERLEKERT